MYIYQVNHSHLVETIVSIRTDTSENSPESVDFYSKKPIQILGVRRSMKSFIEQLFDRIQKPTCSN
jgi:hypothetical protein